MNNENKKNDFRKEIGENGKLIFYALLGTFILCCLIASYNYWLPNAPAFIAEIWGTVNSWLMYLVTVVTAVFLYKTLQSQQQTLQSQQQTLNSQNESLKLQAEMQKDQSELRLIESKRYRKSIAPQLILDTKTSNGNAMIDFYFKENNSQNITVRAKKEIIVLYDNLGNYRYTIPHVIKESYYTYEHDRVLKIGKSFNIIIRNEYFLDNGKFEINLKYEDSDGNKMLQDIVVTKNKYNDYHCYDTAPIYLIP